MNAKLKTLLKVLTFVTIIIALYVGFINYRDMNFKKMFGINYPTSNAERCAIKPMVEKKLARYNQEYQTVKQIYQNSLRAAEARPCNSKEDIEERKKAFRACETLAEIVNIYDDLLHNACSEAVSARIVSQVMYYGDRHRPAISGDL